MIIKQEKKKKKKKHELKKGSNKRGKRKLLQSAGFLKGSPAEQKRRSSEKIASISKNSPPLSLKIR
jgi:hypothetical protein